MARSMALSDVTFVVVDIETNGSLPEKNAITEIGALKLRGGKIIERFEQLINPEQPIPPFIQQLTGITPDTVKDAPTIDQVMPMFLEFLGDAVFVAHNVSFDFRFIAAKARQVTGEILENPQLCTCRLAKKLLPDLRKKGLDSVTRFFEIPIEHRHRAMGDAEATAQVLLRFLSMLEEIEITTLARLMTFQKSGGKRYGDIRIAIDSDTLSSFPQTPGVYRMMNDKGEILYIGKAKNLRRRLQSYFTNPRRQPPKVQELLPQVMGIEVTELGSELEALLEEARLIKAHQPYYNRQIKNFRAFPFLKISTAHRYPSLAVADDIEADQNLYFGPYHQKHWLRDLIKMLSQVFQLRACSDTEFESYRFKGSPCMAFDVGTCSGPCVKAVSSEDYQAQVTQIVDFLEGRTSQVLDVLTAQRDACSETLAFEKAQQIQQRITGLLKLQTSTQNLIQAVHQNHFMIILPEVVPERRRILYVYQGRPFDTQCFDPQTDSLEGVADRVKDIQHLMARPPLAGKAHIAKQELEELRILLHWLKFRDPTDKHSTVIALDQPVEKILGDALAVLFGPGAPASC